MRKFKPLLLVWPDNNYAARIAVQQFADKVALRTEGQITIAAVPIGKLVNQPALVKMVMSGEADMALPAHDRLRECSKLFGCIGTPFVFENHTHADRVLDGEFARTVDPVLSALGMVYLGSWDWGFRQITNARCPILEPIDMHGLKIRVPTTPLCQATIRALGATPVMVEFEQLARVIQQGLIDGQENPVAVIHALGLHLSQGYLSMLNYTYGTIVHVVNKMSFENLAPEHQLVLREESRHAAQLMRFLTRTQEADQLDFFVRHGMRVDHPDPAPFKELMAPVHAMLEQALGTEATRDFQAMVERQRALALQESK